MVGAKKAPYKHDDDIPIVVAKAKGHSIISIPDFVLEGGSVELDGNGTAILCKSSVVSKNRNPEMSIQEAKMFLQKYLGVSNIIWLEGVLDEDITDAHIDGMARFYDHKTILTVSEKDFMELYENIRENDYYILTNSTNADGQLYEIIELPMTSKKCGRA